MNCRFKLGNEYLLCDGHVRDGSAVRFFLCRYSSYAVNPVVKELEIQVFNHARNIRRSVGVFFRTIRKNF